MSVGVKVDVVLDDYTLKFTASSIRKMFRETTMDEAKQIQRVWKDLQKGFSPKSRTRSARKTGNLKDGDGDVIWSSVGFNKDSGFVLLWLEDGTDVRYRTMSYNWRSKTSPGGGLKTGPGKGKALGFNFKMPYRGIKPRYFRDDIVRTRMPTYYSHAKHNFYLFLRSHKWI